MTKVQIFCTSILPHTIKRFNKTKSLVVKLGFYLLVLWARSELYLYHFEI